MSQPYLFYSEKCPHSKQIIETLKALNKSSLYKFILVESLPRNQIPQFLKKVPTLYNPESKEVVVGKDIFGKMFVNGMPEEGIIFSGDGGFPEEVLPVVQALGKDNVLIVRIKRDQRNVSGIISGWHL